MSDRTRTDPAEASTTSKRWDWFVYWARRFHQRDDFDREERDYKQEIAARMQRARDLLQQEDPEWHGALKRAFGSPNNLTDFRTHGPFLDWADSDVGRQALLAIWAPDQGCEERIRNFCRVLPTDVVAGRGLRTNLASVLHLAHDVERWPPYRWKHYDQALRWSGQERPKSKKHLDEAGLYRHALAFLDRFDGEARARGLELRDRLDVQGVIWSVTQWDCTDWPPADRRALDAWRRNEGEPPWDDIVGPRPGDGTQPPPPPPSETLEELADTLHLNAAFLQTMYRLLRARGQVIFYGPPGTGKTFVARKLAEHLAGGDPDSVLLVQFHPSYAYEDFVEGFRPNRDGNGFILRQGPLLRIAARARANPGQDHFLIIDEINRGNLAKVFGELFFLLEYRGEHVTLQYSDTPVALPPNLYVIGTMNTADRSIAVIDAALRRRFHFVAFRPEEEPIRSLLARWLDDNELELEWLPRLLAHANAKLGDRDAAIGPSHFMKDDLDEQWVEEIWEHSVLPYLADHFFDAPDRLGEFDLAVLRAGLDLSAPSGGDSSPDGDDEAT